MLPNLALAELAREFAERVKWLKSARKCGRGVEVYEETDALRLFVDEHMDAIAAALEERAQHEEMIAKLRDEIEQLVIERGRQAELLELRQDVTRTALAQAEHEQIEGEPADLVAACDELDGSDPWILAAAEAEKKIDAALVAGIRRTALAQAALVCRAQCQKPAPSIVGQTFGAYISVGFRLGCEACADTIEALRKE